MNRLSDSKIIIRELGTIEYQAAWDLQHQILKARIKSEIPNTLLSLQHKHVITLGRKFPAVRELEAKGTKEWEGVPLFFAERGGQATYHGPGQLVIYPIFSLSAEFGPRHFLRLLEEAIIECLGEYNIESFPIEDSTGVWLKDDLGQERKIASLGIAVRNHVSYHGLALNISTDLSYFKKISPCGFQSNVMCSMESILGPIDFDAVKLSLQNQIIARYSALSLAKESETSIHGEFNHEL